LPLKHASFSEKEKKEHTYRETLGDEQVFTAEKLRFSTQFSV